MQNKPCYSESQQRPRALPWEPVLPAASGEVQWVQVRLVAGSGTAPCAAVSWWQCDYGDLGYLGHASCLCYFIGTTRNNRRQQTPLPRTRINSQHRYCRCFVSWLCLRTSPQDIWESVARFSASPWKSALFHSKIRHSWAIENMSWIYSVVSNYSDLVMMHSFFLRGESSRTALLRLLLVSFSRRVGTQTMPPPGAFTLSSISVLFFLNEIKVKLNCLSKMFVWEEHHRTVLGMVGSQVKPVYKHGAPAERRGIQENKSLGCHLL